MVSRKTLALLLVAGICVLALAGDLLFGFVTAPEPAVQGRRPSGPNAEAGTSPGVWVVVAAIAGAVFTSLGAFLNDFYASRREDRLAGRQAEEQRQRWDREDRAQAGEKEEAHRQQVREQRARSYKAFAAATTFPSHFIEERQREFSRELNERYTDVLLYCSDMVRGRAEIFTPLRVMLCANRTKMSTTTAARDSGKHKRTFGVPSGGRQKMTTPTPEAPYIPRIRFCRSPPARPRLAPPPCPRSSRPDNTRPKVLRPLAGRAYRTVWRRTAGRGYSWAMTEEDAVLAELMDHLGDASRSIRVSRRLLVERASEEDDPGHLRLLARLSEALDATETASREARRQRGIG